MPTFNICRKTRIRGSVPALDPFTEQYHDNNDLTMTANASVFSFGYAS